MKTKDLLNEVKAELQKERAETRKVQLKEWLKEIEVAEKIVKKAKQQFEEYLEEEV